MMKKTLFAASLAAAFALSGHAHAASNWGIDHEEKSRMTVKVVDILCELTGNCAENCGNGKRQLGILTKEGKLIPAVKNFEIWAGATADLIKYCNKQVIVDGLLIKDPLMHMFTVQFTKALDEGSKWQRANQFTKDWKAKNPDKSNVKNGRWYLHDPLIKKTIEKKGQLGLPGVEYKDE